jgi:Flp pilus assembly pilin Flp
MRAYHLRRRRRDERGAAAVVFGLLSVVLLGVAALGTDVGNMVARRTASQTSADFAAFAAAHELNRTVVGGVVPSADAVAEVRDYLNHNQPQDDELTCSEADPPTCVTSAELTDGDLDNGEVRSCPFVDLDPDTPDCTVKGLQVVAPKTRVDFGLAGIFGSTGTYVDATATVNVFTGGQRVMPMFAVSACDYGRQTLTDPATGHVTPITPVVALPGESNNTVLATATLANSAGATVTEIPLSSTGNILTLTASKWDKTKKIGFFREGSTDPALIVSQDYFWLESDDPDGADIDSLPRTDLTPATKPAGMSDSDYAKLYSNNPSTTVRAMIPDTVALTEGVWWVRVWDGETSGQWSDVDEALPIRVGGALLECAAGPSSGNFGTLKLPRTDVASGFELPVNIAVGLQQPLTPAIHQWAVDHPLEDGTCSDGTNDAVESFGTTLRPATNCVDTDTGLPANVATQGMITGAGGHPGMLTTRPTKTGCNPTGGSSDRRVDLSPRDYDINDDLLTCYLTNGTTSLADIASASYSGGPVLDADIYSAPRFIWIPVLKVQPFGGGSNRYSIVDFRPAFITDEQAVTSAVRGSYTGDVLSGDNGITMQGNDIKQIKVVFFNVNALPTDGEFPVIDFLGVGKPIVRLVD